MFVASATWRAKTLPYGVRTAIPAPDEASSRAGVCS